MFGHLLSFSGEDATGLWRGGGRGMARSLLAAAGALLLLGGLLLLLLISAGQAGGRILAGQEVPSALVPQALQAQGALPLSRAKRATPFWRMVGSKPLGAPCSRGLECSTHLCRSGRCADPRVQS
ncbi:liver-expressed antimicrobial peptide 2 [Pogona vitticeps]